ncbi:MAG: hypothetical protein HY063_04420, partial [Bacteroidetes bacterium]|nr:hypothetical protein [Bacteroidota bacterium]
MKNKTTLAFSIAIALLCLNTNFTFAQWVNNLLPFAVHTSATTQSGGVGNFTLANLPLSAFHINTNLMPTSSNFTPGNLFRTDGPNTFDNMWQMFTVPTGKNPVTKEIGDILSPAGSIDFMMRSAQPGGTLQFQTNTG